MALMLPFELDFSSYFAWWAEELSDITDYCCFVDCLSFSDAIIESLGVNFCSCFALFIVWRLNFSPGRAVLADPGASDY